MQISLVTLWAAHEVGTILQGRQMNSRWLSKQFKAILLKKKKKKKVTTYFKELDTHQVLEGKVED